VNPTLRELDSLRRVVESRTRLADTVRYVVANDGDEVTVTLEADTGRRTNGRIDWLVLHERTASTLELAVSALWDEIEPPDQDAAFEAVEVPRVDGHAL
jgi:hypothetical protein